VKAEGTLTITCTNKGGTLPPGRQTLPIERSASGTFQSDKNGNVTGKLTTDPVTLSARQACPSNNWTLTLNVDFQSFEFIVQQGATTPIDNQYTIN